jgi:hypothetical protein
MKVQTESGVSISSILDESSPTRVLLVFDRPVRSIELSKDESLQVASLLTSNVDLKKRARKKGKRKIIVPPKDDTENGRAGR